MPEAARMLLPATRIEIDLGVVRNNLRAIRRMAGARKVIAVVKGDAYGHGAAAVARTAEAEGADYIAAGNLDEAIAIRGAGITAPILVLGSLTVDAAAEVVRHTLIASVDDTRAADALAGAAHAPQPVWIKVDCGFGRYGVALPRALASLWRRGPGESPSSGSMGSDTHLRSPTNRGALGPLGKFPCPSRLLLAGRAGTCCYASPCGGGDGRKLPGFPCGSRRRDRRCSGPLAIWKLDCCGPISGIKLDIPPVFAPCFTVLLRVLADETEPLEGETVPGYLRHSPGSVGHRAGMG